MLYCDPCGNELFGDEMRQPVKPLSVEMSLAEIDNAENRTARFEVIDFCVALRAKGFGLSPVGARLDACQLGRLWWTAQEIVCKRLIEQNGPKNRVDLSAECAVPASSRGLTLPNYRAS